MQSEQIISEIKAGSTSTPIRRMVAELAQFISEHPDITAGEKRHVAELLRWRFGHHMKGNQDIPLSARDHNFIYQWKHKGADELVVFHARKWGDIHYLFDRFRSAMVLSWSGNYYTGEWHAAVMKKAEEIVSEAIFLRVKYALDSTPEERHADDDIAKGRIVMEFMWSFMYNPRLVALL